MKNYTDINEYKKILVDKDIINQFEAIFKYANEAIIITDSSSEIQKINPAGIKMFGYNEYQEIENHPIEVLIPKRYHTSHIGHREKYQERPKARSMGVNYELFGQKKDGTEFPVEVSLSPFKNENGSFVVCFVIDITNRKKAEEAEKNYRHELEKEVEERTLILKEAIQKLEKTKVELDQSLKREQELNSMKTRFISIASHEFRTPLSTVLSSLSLVEKYGNLNETEKRAKHIDRIKKSIRNLTDILNDILSVNRIEEGAVVVNLDSFNLKYFVEELVSELNGILKIGQQILLEGFEDLKSNINQDPKLVRHILINLLSNAIKFSPEDKNIIVRASNFENDVTIEIIDQGIGIPEEDQKKLFTRFFRCTNAENIQGTGLGLSIVYQYLILLKGKINYTSEVKKGSTFKVTLPKNN